MARTKIECKNPVLRAGAHYMTSEFGERVLNGVKGTHNGVDLVGGTDKTAATDYVIACESGVVTHATNNVEGKTPSEGNAVYINHGNGYYSYYFHLKKGTVKVKAGDYVARGDVIAYMGNTGNSTGAHLHFAIKKDGKWIDPLPYLKGESGIGVLRYQITVRALRRGDKGADVTVMQKLINSYGASLDLDGSYGPLCEEAVKKYQSENGLSADGKCGPLTWSSLLRTGKL